MRVRLILFELVALISRPAFSKTETEKYVWHVRRESYPLLVNSSWTILPDANGFMRFVVLKQLASVSPALADRWIVRFFLFTRKTGNMCEELLIDDKVRLFSTTFNASQPVKLVIHGYLSSAIDHWVIRTKNNLLREGDFNVICVDWSDHSNTAYYPSAAKSAASVGRLVADLLDFLAIQTGLNMKNVHVIGHSIGAHISAVAGRRVLFGPVGRLSGLDPAHPLFDSNDVTVTLSVDAADFVDCIHTCGGYLGIDAPICHADFYPNGGKMNQPGCSYLDFGACSHVRSHDYFEESIVSIYKFNAYRCPSIPNSSDVTCYESSALMGYPAKSRNHGIFYVKTGSTYPYSNLS